MDPKHLQGLPSGLAEVLGCIAATVLEISDILRAASATSAQAGSKNQFGDNQLQVDVQVDNLIFDRLASCSSVQSASSEEQPEVRQLGGQGYSVTFDPLDGSSILSANFAVGSIFGVWHAPSPVGCSGRQQSAAAYAVYGPQTILVWARPREPGQEPPEAATNGVHPAPTTSTHVVQEFVLCHASRGWLLRRSDLAVKPTSNTFAPANLRAAAANAEYAALVQQWIAKAFTLRYTGGMVPDVHHILAKGHGVFCNPCSSSAPAKLRLAFECAPLAFIMEAAGGSSTTGAGSVLDLPVQTPNDKTKICLGSSQLVEDALPAMKAA